MRLLDRLRGASATRSTPLLSDAQYSFLQSYGASDRELILPTFNSYASLGYGANAVVFGCVLQRMNLFSEATFKFRSLADKKMFGTGALGLLEQPWPGATTGELLARMEQDASMAGNAFVRNAGDCLERLRPDRVTIVSEVTTDGLGRQIREVIGYTYDVAGFDVERHTEYYTVDEVAHWSPIPDPLASFRGMSWLTPILREIDSDSSMTDHKLKHLGNAATPNLLLKYARKLDPTDVEAIRRRFNAKYSGSDNSGRALLLDDGADATVIGSTLANMDFSAVQSAGTLRIGFAAGIPPELMPQPAAAKPPDTVYTAAMRRFADTTMRPNWRSACAALAKLVDVPTGAQLWFDTTDISALQPGEMDAAATSQQQAGTINTLIMAGFTPDSSVRAVTAGDMSLLEHNGLVSVQMQSISGSDQAPAEQPALPPAPSGAMPGDTKALDAGTK